MTQLGEFSLWVALLMAAWCVTLSVQGALAKRASLAESGARGLYVSLVFTALAAAGLIAAFMGDEFSIRYVALHSSSNMESIYKFSALWSGSQGELLLASLMIGVSGAASAPFVLRGDPDRSRTAWVVALLGLLLAAFLAATAFRSNPFAHVGRAPSDGRGLDPLLRNPAMAVQPPLMILGAAATAVPVAMLAAALIVRRAGGGWVARVRAASLVAWVVLSSAILLGVHWAYVTPGLRALREHSPVVILSVISWIALAALLVTGELRRPMHATFSEADIMRRRAGRVVMIVGGTLVLAALAAYPLRKEYRIELGDGEQYRANDAWGHQWTFTSQGASRIERPGDDVTAVALLPTREGTRQPFVTSESRQYFGASGLDIFPPQPVPGIRSTLAQDSYVVVGDIGEGSTALRISFRPLVEFDWIGGVLLVLGGLLFFWIPRTQFAA